MHKNLHTTDEAKKLYETLLKVGVNAKLECGDGHKHVDICVPEAKLYIEVEGPPHFLKARQILKDFERDDYSAHDGYETFRVPNHHIDEDLYKLVGAIKKVVEARIEQLKSQS